MKKNEILTAMLATAALLPIGTSCSNTENEEITQIESTPRTVNIQTRTAEDGAAIDWPLTLYAFNSSGNMTASTTVNDAETAAELQLNKGSYTLVALAGTDNLEIPAEPKLTDDIGIPTGCILTTAPQITTLPITVASDDITKDMTLTYPVAQVKMTLTDMPTDISEATATLSPLYTSIAFNGTTSGNSSATLTLTKQEDGSWTSGNTFVMPSAENLSLTITTGDESYTVATTSTLEAGKTYALNGTYKGEVTVTVSFGIQNWTPGDDIDFDITGKEDTAPDDAS